MTDIKFTSDEILADIHAHYGVVPNIFKKLSTSKVALKSYFDIVNNLIQADLSDIERQIVYLTICHIDNCNYCLKSHLYVAHLLGLPEEESALMKQNQLPKTPKYIALVKITRLLIEKRGKISKEEADFFFKEDFSEQALYEIITIIAMKTISNFVENYSAIELDEAIK